MFPEPSPALHLVYPLPKPAARRHAFGLLAFAHPARLLHLDFDDALDLGLAGEARQHGAEAALLAEGDDAVRAALHVSQGYLGGVAVILYRSEMRGAVWIEALPTATMPLWQLTERAGMVFQNPAAQLLATTVENEVIFGLENLGLPRAEIEVRLEEALARFGLAALRRRSVATPDLPPGSIPITLDGRFAAAFTPADLERLQTVSFVDAEEGKTQEGWLLRDVLRLTLDAETFAPWWWRRWRYGCRYRCRDTQASFGWRLSSGSGSGTQAQRRDTRGTDLRHPGGVSGSGRFRRAEHAAFLYRRGPGDRPRLAVAGRPRPAGDGDAGGSFRPCSQIPGQMGDGRPHRRAGRLCGAGIGARC